MFYCAQPIYILDSHSLQHLCQIFVLLQYILFENDSAQADRNTAVTEMQDMLYTLNLVFKYVMLS